jgi:hypothetical protein
MELEGSYQMKNLFISLIVICFSFKAHSFPNICDVVKTIEFNSCMSVRKSGCTCGSWPFLRPCVRMSYYIPQSFIEVFHEAGETFFKGLPGVMAQLSTVQTKKVPFGIVNSDGTYTYNSHTLSIPFNYLLNMLSCGGARMEKYCFDGMSEHLGSHWKTGKADLMQPKFLAWSVAPKACLIKGAATSVVGKEPVFNGEGACSYPLDWLKVYPPSSHSMCNGWGAFFPRSGTYHGSSQTAGALMIASRMKSISSEVYRNMPSTFDEKWQMITPNSSSCFNEGQNLGLLESPVKRVIEHGRLTRGKLKGYLFATWKKVSCCVDYPYVPAFYAALAAIKAACI